MENVILESGSDQESKGPNYFKLFFNMVRKVKLDFVYAIVIFSVGYFNHGIIQTHNVYLDLHRILWDPLSTILYIRIFFSLLLLEDVNMKQSWSVITF